MACYWVGSSGVVHGKIILRRSEARGQQLVHNIFKPFLHKVGRYLLINWSILLWRVLFIHQTKV